MEKPVYSQKNITDGPNGNNNNGIVILAIVVLPSTY